MVNTVDETWCEVCAQAPGILRADLAALPNLLGISSRGRFDDYVTMRPMAQLPALVQLPRADAFVVAHHLAGFTMLARDRAADGQVQDREAVDRCVTYLEPLWRRALGRATGDPDGSDWRVTQALVEWWAGVKREQQVLHGDAPAEERVVGYRRSVRERTRWLALATVSLLDRETSEQSPYFIEVYDLVMLGMQLFDDAIDADADRAERGGDFPSALTVSPTVFLRASEIVMREAGARAELRGFGWWRPWCEERAATAGALALREGLPYLSSAAAIGALSLVAPFLVAPFDL